MSGLVPGGHPAAGRLVETFVHAELTRLLSASHLGGRTHSFGDRMTALPLSAMWQHATP